MILLGMRRARTVQINQPTGQHFLDFLVRSRHFLRVAQRKYVTKIAMVSSIGNVHSDNCIRKVL